MDTIADLHIHSRFSRACSKDLNLANLEKYARMKGIGLLGTGDFQHPLWQKELKEQLKEDGSGILRSESGYPFLLSTEVSNMFTQGKGRRVHSVILAPSFEVVDQITEALGKRGRLDYDGRPIFGFSCMELVEMMQGISKEIEVIPAHAWTPWFGILGSKSGFDSLEECYQEQMKHVHALETGLSSDPPMNGRLSQLDEIQLVSFSDCHSFWPHRIGREATLFQSKELTYDAVLKGVRTGVGLSGTIEVDPAYGKYHWNGHRTCEVVFSPEESLKRKNVCPACKRELTIGVEHRVVELADRAPDQTRARPFERLIPLSEIIAAVLGTQPFSKKVWTPYHRLVGSFGNEFRVLRNASQGELENVVDKHIAEAIVSVRNGSIEVTPGYDGVYGELSISTRPKKQATTRSQGQRSLSDF